MTDPILAKNIVGEIDDRLFKMELLHLYLENEFFKYWTENAM